MPRTTKRLPSFDELMARDDPDEAYHHAIAKAKAIGRRDVLREAVKRVYDCHECEALNGMLADAAREVTEAWRRPAKVKKVQP